MQSFLPTQAAAGIVLLIFTIIGFIGGIVLFFTFMSKKNEGQFSGFLGWLYGFLNFKVLFAETLLRALYVIAACTITMWALAILFSGASFGGAFLAFLLLLVFGNVIVRIIYEFLLIRLIIAKNTSEINEKLGHGAPKGPSSPVPAPAPAPAPAFTPAPAPAPAEAPAKGPAGQFCPSCGAPLGFIEQFCPKCGTKVR
jgi:hypothetical protein